MSLRLVIAAVVFVLLATDALGAPDPAASCHAAKLKATGKAVGGLLGCHAKASKAGLTPSPTCIARAEQSITNGFAKAEARGGCSSEGDAGAVGEAVSGSVVAIVAALRPALTASTCVSKKLGAAGKYGAPVLTAHAANVTRADHSTEKVLRRLLAPDVLILDDFGLRRLDARQSSDFYEVVLERHRRASTIVTSNRTIDEWIPLFDDPILAQSAIDRLAYNAYQVVIEGESYRKRQRPGEPRDAARPSRTPISRRKRRSH